MSPGYLLPTPYPALLPSAPSAVIRLGGFITHCPQRCSPGSPWRDAPLWGCHVTRLGEGMRRRAGQVTLLLLLGFQSFPPRVSAAHGRSEGRGEEAGCRWMQLSGASRSSELGGRRGGGGADPFGVSSPQGRSTQSHCPSCLPYFQSPNKWSLLWSESTAVARN